MYDHDSAAWIPKNPKRVFLGAILTGSSAPLHGSCGRDFPSFLAVKFAYVA
jgi:hypothetical protein